VVGTSSGALAAALFANGYDSFEIATGEETFSFLDLKIPSSIRVMEGNLSW
jgi:predicted acylesterase/phospholipase RssA